MISEKIILKNYIYYLLQVLTITNDLMELEDLLILYNSLFIKNDTKHQFFYKKLKLFLRHYRKIKPLLLTKSDLILFNKIYKILVELNKLLKTNDVNEFLDLSLEELKSKNLLIFLPYKLKVVFSFENKKK
jgi:hypothetical protein